jgi:4-amino-4-deoxy-L-arabinose transferase-like glycosyltransferase
MHPTNGTAQRRGDVLLGAATLALLVPFLGKPLHIDDPLFVWAARWIAAHPGDFYGFEINWYGRRAPLYEVFKNPPLTSYWLAAVGGLFGWGERALHAGMLAPAVAAVLGTAALARRLRAPPVLAGLLLLAMPAFLVSATSLMADVWLLALWTWAAALWLRGLEQGLRGSLALAALLSALAVLAKYPGLSLVPLLGACALAQGRRAAGCVVWLALPVAAALGFSLAMSALYGVQPFLDVSAYATGFAAGTGVPPAGRLLVGLSFLGGAALPVLLLAPWLWPRRVLAGGGLLLAAALALLPRLGSLGGTPLVGEDGGARWDVVTQLGVFCLGGVQLLALAAAELRGRRDAGAWLLALWLFGVFVFAAFLNWTTNARALLPAAPAAALLAARRLARADAGAAPGPSVALAAAGATPGPRVALAAALALALAVAWGDTRHARSAHAAAQELSALYGAGSGRVYFTGSWGFQYYLEAAGAERLDVGSWQLAPGDVGSSRLAPGDVVLVPENSSNFVAFPAGSMRAESVHEYPAARFVALLSQPRAAGFHASLWGVLPFSFGPAPPERYLVLVPQPAGP